MNTVSLLSDPRARLQPSSQAPVWTLPEAAQSLPGVLQRELEIIRRGQTEVSVFSEPGQDTQTTTNKKNTNTQQTLFFHI